MSAGVASVNFLCTFVGLFLVERIGRRKLLLVSLFGVVLSLAFLAVGFQLADTNTPKVSINETYLSDNEFCSTKPDCSSCTFNTGCGFCYQVLIWLKFFVQALFRQLFYSYMYVEKAAEMMFVQKICT